MDRLIVEAVSAEMTVGATSKSLRIYVSVSRATNGASVTKLTPQNFRITTSHLGEDPIIGEVSETFWEPKEKIRSGCYVIYIARTPVPPQDWDIGEFYSFGIQVRTFSKPPLNRPGEHSPKPPPPPKITGSGQTVVSVRNLV